MDNFILENDTWLRYLPMIIYTLTVVIIVLLIIIGFLIWKKYRNKSLKSQRYKSNFANAYADCQSSKVLSTKRNHVTLEHDVHFTHINPSSRVSDIPKPVVRPSIVISTVSGRRVFANNSKIHDLYFEFEDEYMI